MHKYLAIVLMLVISGCFVRQDTRIENRVFTTKEHIVEAINVPPTSRSSVTASSNCPSFKLPAPGPQPEEPSLIGLTDVEIDNALVRYIKALRAYNLEERRKLETAHAAYLKRCKANTTP